MRRSMSIRGETAREEKEETEENKSGDRKTKRQNKRNEGGKYSEG